MDQVTLLHGDFTVETVPGRVETDDLLLANARPVDESAFKEAMRCLPSGVVMVTTRINGRPWGLTISSCCSMTLRPPQIMISLQQSTASYREIILSRRFGISILGTRHKSLAEHGSAVGVAKFIDEFVLRGSQREVGSPVVSGALFHLDCRVAARHDVKDHAIIVGLVEGAVSMYQKRDDPLLYFNQRFFTLGSPL
jgi:flavin reductase (DIM6/NTAB) family NADH-FMN oxidoreductase RutF